MTSHSNPNCEALRDDLVALLYDDGELAERSRARDHLARCVPCRAEYAELKTVRKELGGWTLPTSTTAVADAPKAGVRWFPAGLAAAAGLILGIGVSMAGRSVLTPSSSQAGPIASGQAPATLASSEGSAPRFVPYDELRELLKTQEGRHQAELADLRQSILQVSASLVPQESSLKSVSNVSPAVIEKLLRESEARQARLVEARLNGLKTQTDLQRQYDMAQIAAGLAYIDSRTGADAARTSELMKNLVRVTAKPQDR
jgi:hypothetical protein